jgi:hypothetical protein
MDVRRHAWTVIALLLEGIIDPARVCIVGLNLDAISPIKHIDAINVRVMLIHARDDTIVPFDQSDVMLSAIAAVAFLEAINPPN